MANFTLDRARGVTALVVATLAFVTGSCREEARTRPNVLLITIDTLRADHLGCYGYARPTSPALDAFAARSVVFESAQSSASWTLPSLASIHTSLYSTTHGCWKIASKLQPEFTTLAERLRGGGWDTALVACHLFLSAQYGLQQGFTHVDDAMIRTAADSDEAISSPGVTERGLAFIEEQAAAQFKTPWMLWLHYFDPHDKYLAHEGISEAFGTEREIDLYDGEIAFTDRYVGRVLARLQELGLEENTIVVITSDHGEEFGEHGFQRHGYTLYQEAVHIPLIVKAPGVAPRRVRDTVSNVDVMPSLLELCGVPWSDELEGQSLVPLLRGEPSPAREALSEVRWHQGQDMRALRSGDWKYLEHRNIEKQKDGTKALVAVDLLFDLASDPKERDDLIARDAARAKELGERVIHRIGRALAWAARYPLPEEYAPSPGDAERLMKLGYAGDEEPTTNEDGK